jgi:hypothetical protein
VEVGNGEGAFRHQQMIVSKCMIEGRYLARHRLEAGLAVRHNQGKLNVKASCSD